MAADLLVLDTDSVGHLGYRLTGNLDITSINPPNTNAIEVNAEDVTIDLGGFEILGPTVCSGQPVTGCVPTGTANGITTTPMLGKKGLRVRNGTIRGMGANGLRFGRPGTHLSSPRSRWRACIPEKPRNQPTRR